MILSATGPWTAGHSSPDTYDRVGDGESGADGESLPQPHLPQGFLGLRHTGH